MTHGTAVAVHRAMTCSQCGAMLQSASGFCGACGHAVVLPPAAYPLQQAAYPAAAPYPQQSAYPQPAPYSQPYAPPPPAPAPQWQQAQPPPAYPQGSSPQYPQYPQPTPPPLEPFPLVMQQRFTRLTGHMFIAPSRLYFICTSKKGAIASAVGRGVGGLLGAAISALGTPTPGQAPIIDEPTLQQAVQQMEGSLIMEPAQIKQIKSTMWTRGIWFNGLTYALPSGMEKRLERALGQWCHANNVKNAGLV